jgi:hypothetical protein
VRKLFLVSAASAAVTMSAGLARADEPKSEQTAQILSGVGTGASSVLILTAFIAGDSSYPYNKGLMYTGLATAMITPSLGEFYAHEYITVGMAARALGVGLATYGLTHYTQPVTCDPGYPAGSTCRHLDSGAIPFLGLAAIAFVGGMAYDVGDAADTVRNWNEHHGFMVAPTVVRAADGPAPGLSFVGQF